MARVERKTSCTGIYHIMLRGINKQDIFYDDKDRIKFIEMLDRFKKVSSYTIYAYCLMSNHIHLLMKEGEEGISQSMKRIGVSYAYWFNAKYGRYGHLFQDRFKSENVENERYLLAALRYIHMNPMKAGIVQKVDEYKWSSYKEYISQTNGLIDKSLILGIFNSQGIKSIEMYKDFMIEKNDDICLDNETEKRIFISDEDARKILKRLINVDNPQALKKMNKQDRDEIIKRLREQVSIRQLSRITGIGRNIIQKV